MPPKLYQGLPRVSYLLLKPVVTSQFLSYFAIRNLGLHRSYSLPKTLQADPHLFPKALPQGEPFFLSVWSSSATQLWSSRDSIMASCLVFAPWVSPPLCAHHSQTMTSCFRFLLSLQAHIQLLMHCLHLWLVDNSMIGHLSSPYCWSSDAKQPSIEIADLTHSFEHLWAISKLSRNRTIIFSHSFEL